MLALHWCCYKWLNIKHKQNFSAVRQVTHSCFTITPAFTVWRLQWSEHFIIQTCSLTDAGTQNIPWKGTCRRDGSKNTCGENVRYSISLTRCTNDIGDWWWAAIIPLKMGNLRLIDLNLELYGMGIAVLLAWIHLSCFPNCHSKATLNV